MAGPNAVCCKSSKMVFVSVFIAAEWGFYMIAEKIFWTQTYLVNPVTLPVKISMVLVFSVFDAVNTIHKPATRQIPKRSHGAPTHYVEQSTVADRDKYWWESANP